MMRTILLLLGAAALLLVAGGCIFSPDEDKGDPTIDRKELQFPDTRDKLMENFKTIYENMDINGYRTLLHPDYLTYLQASTIDDFPDVGSELDYTEEMTIHTNMFSGAAGRDREGNLTTPISSIVFQEPLQLTSWRNTTVTDPIPNAEIALFDVKFEFNRGGDKTLLVEGQIEFYLTSRDSLHDGAVRPYYQMIGQVDHTFDTPTP